MGKGFSKDKFKLISDREAIIDGNLPSLKALLRPPFDRNSLKNLFKMQDFEKRNPIHLVTFRNLTLRLATWAMQKLYGLF